MSRGDEPEPLRPGQCVGDGRYVLGEMLGRGGLASVFAAEDRVRVEEVALKVLRVRYVGRPEREERLWRELEYTRRVEHPAFVKAYEGGRLEARRPFFAMERVHGQPLSQVLSGGGRLPIERLLGLGRGLAEALEVLHRQGIVHRDVKPANVLVLEGDRIKLLDLGMAGDENAPALPVGHMGRLTRANDLLGTHEYMAPEQVLKTPPQRAMDVFALGVVLYEMLAGITPYSGMKVREYVELQIDGDPHVRSAARWARLRGAPVELAELIDACRVREPGQRPHVGVVLEQLERMLVQQAARRALVRVPAHGLAKLSRPQELPEVVAAPVPSPLAPSSAFDVRAGRGGWRTRRWRWRAAVAVAVPVVSGLVGWLARPADPRGAVEQLAAASSATEHEGAPLVASRPSLAVAAHTQEPGMPTAVVERPVASTTAHEPAGETSAVRATPSPHRERRDPVTPCDLVRANAEAAAQRRDWTDVVRMTAKRRCWTEPTDRVRLEVRALAQLQRWEACVTAGRGSTDEDVEGWVVLCNNHVHPGPGGA